jgi:hypothetical protein
MASHIFSLPSARSIPPHKRAALSKESLSIAADNYDESLPSVRKHIRDGIKLEKLAA